MMSNANNLFYQEYVNSYLCEYVEYQAVVFLTDEFLSDVHMEYSWITSIKWTRPPHIVCTNTGSWFVKPISFAVIQFFFATRTRTWVPFAVQKRQKRKPDRNDGVSNKEAKRTRRAGYFGYGQSSVAWYRGHYDATYIHKGNFFSQ